MKLIIPFVKSGKHNNVIWAEDIEINLFDTYLTINVEAIEEVPIDPDDLILGYKEDKKSGCSLIKKDMIVAIEHSYDNKIECYDFTIYTNTSAWGYNCETKADSKKWYNELTTWLLS